MKLTMNLSRDSLVVDALRFDTKTVDAMVFDRFDVFYELDLKKA